MAAIVSVSKVKRFIGIPAGVTMYDEMLEYDLIPLAEHQVNAWCGTPAITVTTYNEIYDVDGTSVSEIVLRQFPVSSVAALTNSGGAVGSTEYYTDTETGVIRLIGSGSFFTDGRQKVKVTYTAGVNPETHQDLKTGIVMLCAFHFNASRNVGITFEKSGRYQYKRSADGMPPVIATLLARYVRAFARS